VFLCNECATERSISLVNRFQPEDEDGEFILHLSVTGTVRINKNLHFTQSCQSSSPSRRLHSVQRSLGKTPLPLQRPYCGDPPATSQWTVAPPSWMVRSTSLRSCKTAGVSTIPLGLGASPLKEESESVPGEFWSHCKICCPTISSWIRR